MAPTLPSPEQLTDRLRTDVARKLRRARNGAKLLFGQERPPIAQTPKETVWSSEKVQLWRYRATTPSSGIPVLIVHSLISRSYLFDLTPGNSVVEALLAKGHDVYLIDWGVPDVLEAHNTVETYTNRYLPTIVHAVTTTSGQPDINLVGYCFGGVLSLLYLAGHPDAPVRSLATVATPIEFDKMTVMAQMLDKGRVQPSDLFDSSGNVPPDVLLASFKFLQPTADITAYVNLFEHLHSDEFVAAYQVISGWGNEHIPFPGAAFEQLVRLFFRDNTMVTGRIPLNNGEVQLSDITVPVLNISGAKDHVVPLVANERLTQLVGSEHTRDLQVPAGHVGLFIGRTAHKGTLPALSQWLNDRSEN